MPISIIAAFLGGVISLFTPCSAMIIPIFAAAISNRRHTPLYTVSVFSSGLIISLIPLGLGASFFSRVFLAHRQSISLIFGLIFLIWGVLTIFGTHLNLPDLSGKVSANKAITRFGSIFTLGVISGLGATACVGPILGAILTLASASTSALGALVLMLAYALGLIIPLVFISIFLNQTKFKDLALIRNKSFRLGSKPILLTDLLMGSLLILVSVIFIFQQGSLATLPLISKSGIIDASFDLQDKLFLIKP